VQLAWTEECWGLCWLAEEPEEQLEAAGTEQVGDVAAAPRLPAALARPRLPPVAVGFLQAQSQAAQGVDLAPVCL